MLTYFKFQIAFPTSLDKATGVLYSSVKVMQNICPCTSKTIAFPCDRYHPEQTWSISGKLSLLWSKYDCMMHNTGEKHGFLPYLSTHIQMSMSHYKPMFRTSRIADKAMTGSGCIHIHPKAPRHSYFISRLSSDALSECIAKYFLEVTGKHESMAKCHAKCESACLINSRV